MIQIERDRREHPRVRLGRPCKVYNPLSRKYVSGETADVSTGGLLVRLDARVDLQAGDQVFVGVAQKRRQALLRSEEMVRATVVRSLSSTDNNTAVALHFNDSTLGLPTLDLVAA